MDTSANTITTMGIISSEVYNEDYFNGDLTKMMEDNPEQFPENIQKSIAEGKIINGMNTFQASLAGGAYFFRVIADPDVWKKDIDPNIVIKAQVNKPDNSQIWMTFQNSTQYQEKEKQTFQVAFEQGKVIDIKNITKDTSC